MPIMNRHPVAKAMQSGLTNVISGRDRLLIDV
jgi:hypothetical protein